MLNRTRVKTPSKKTAAKKTAPAPKAAPAASTSAGRKRVTFQVTAPESSDVSVAGSFNNWETLALNAGSGAKSSTYSKILFLAPGTYEYKFIINGEWLLDPTCQETAPNEHGSQNSLLRLG